MVSGAGVGENPRDGGFHVFRGIGQSIDDQPDKMKRCGQTPLSGLLIATQVEMMGWWKLARVRFERGARSSGNRQCSQCSSCLARCWRRPRRRPVIPINPSLKPRRSWHAIEKVIGDAIASGRAVGCGDSSNKNENGQETLAVRGRKRGAACRCLSRAGLCRSLDTSNMLSFDYGSGVVIGDHGEILTLFHVVRGASKLIVRAAEKAGI